MLGRGDFLGQYFGFTRAGVVQRVRALPVEVGDALDELGQPLRHQDGEAGREGLRRGGTPLRRR